MTMLSVILLAHNSKAVETHMQTIHPGWAVLCAFAAALMFFSQSVIRKLVRHDFMAIEILTLQIQCEFAFGTVTSVVSNILG